MEKLLKTVQYFRRNAAYCCIGFVFIIYLLIIAVFSMPIFLYRWIICKVFASIFGRDLGKAVTVASSVFATELGHNQGRYKPRVAVVVNFVFDGSVKFEHLTAQVHQNWIAGSDPTTGKLKYPEFQQYVGSWIGYLFWKQDKSFNLANHLVHHTCEESWTEMECGKYANSISEELLNKPFPKMRSPWEAHLISNYRNAEHPNKGMEMTVIVFRFHHCLADGNGMLSAFVEGLLKIPLLKCEISKESRPQSKLPNGEAKFSYLKQIVNVASFPIRAMRDIGWGVCLSLIPVKTPWYIPEDRRTGYQFYLKSGKLPIAKLKFIKNKFGVSLTATILSSIAAGVASSFKSKGFGNHIKKIPFGSPLPMKNHPNKLRNHTTAALFEVTIDQSLNPLERLKRSERQYQKAKQSTYPYLVPFALKLAAAQLPIVSRIMMTNRSLSSAMTNFPGPGGSISSFGCEVTEIDFGAGLFMGVAGVGFMVMSYHDHMKISVVAENAALERHELQDLVTAISDEIDMLYEHAKRHEDVTICMTEQ